jgi:response regulator RpfG family c-di-GMP phosphodiesterase
MGMAEIASLAEGATSTDDLARLREVAQERAVENAVDAVREFLGMDVAYATEMTEEEQHFKVLRGDGESFGVGEGTVMPAEATYCRKVLDGRLPNVMPDLAADERTASMPITQQAGVGSFVSVPLRFSDGTLHGTLCAASHDARPELGYRELQALHVFARLIADQFEREHLETRYRELHQQNSAMAALIGAVEARDAYTADHSREVVELATAVSDRLGLDGQAAEQVRQVALLHDIGKISIPDAILCKPGPLDDEEWREMRRHPIYGERLVCQVPGLESLGPAVRGEHERWDGNGYPDGLAGEEIPIASRIVLACDAYHAMISDRPYRSAMDPADARRELADNAGTQFDPEVIEALLAVIGD